VPHFLSPGWGKKSRNQLKKIGNNSTRFIFKDHGPGMDFDKLPSMLFYKGFSTQISLGCGFSLI
jgi:hypothetical protein